ncbi:tRNA wybutosine-synthesizing protein 5-like isoform x1 [Cyclospora cayetanensis]|uniref:tRNA wybutosine-synthesizing protein 5-like isoform x1 n=1 Tax=Cyclospora cayetanensis TaxID=88456 RepID=A0A1D3D6T6_9EIME|nr:tRNA wybutosine-synthesizing protein 5-like isoform x1 [Cyclospora cayetanensis]
MPDMASPGGRSSQLCFPPSLSVPILSECSPEYFLSSIVPRGLPCVIRGAAVGPCVSLWGDPGYLKSKIEDRLVTVHVAPQPERLDFRKKNFKYLSMPFHELLERVQPGQAGQEPAPLLQQGEGYYFRDAEAADSGGKTSSSSRRAARACFFSSYPELAKDVALEDWYCKARYFSSVLRLSSAGLRLFMHYDVPDNIYLQVVGRKRILLWAPEEALNLYLHGDKSLIVNPDDADPSVFPLFATAKRHECLLFPGDLLYIPALWLHSTFSVDCSVAVNIFWTPLEATLYDPKDWYGNRDPLPVQRARQGIEKAIQQLQQLPEKYRDFYGRLLARQIESKCLCKPLFTHAQSTRTDTGAEGGAEADAIEEEAQTRQPNGAE